MAAVPVATVIRAAADGRQTAVGDAASASSRTVTTGGSTTCPQFDWKSVAGTMMARRAYRRRVLLSDSTTACFTQEIKFCRNDYATYGNVCVPPSSVRRRDEVQ
jgi:hypothetical protein